MVFHRTFANHQRFGDFAVRRAMRDQAQYFDFALGHIAMPLGSFTLIFTLNAALMSLFRDQYLLIPVATLAGIIVDLLYWWLKPSQGNVTALRLFAFIVPFVFYLSFFVSIMLYNGGISWTIHLWLGSTFMSGIIGMVLSYLLIAPVGPTTQVE